MDVKLLTISHFQYPDSKIKTDILWIWIFVSALVHTACRAALSHPKQTCDSNPTHLLKGINQLQLKNQPWLVMTMSQHFFLPCLSVGDVYLAIQGERTVCQVHLYLKQENSPPSSNQGFLQLFRPSGELTHLNSFCLCRTYLPSTLQEVTSTS